MPLNAVVSVAFLFSAAALSAAVEAPAVIVNSGSTNTAGFRVVVDKSGDAEYTPTARKYGLKGSGPTSPEHRKLSDALVQRFYSDLKASQPFTSLPRARCMKSASFGTTTVIQFGGEETPDLSCRSAENEHTRALMQDVDEIVAAFRSN